MSLEFKLSTKLGQSLSMTPQLQQAIKLLQLGRMEYLELIGKELLENPLLEDASLEERVASSQEKPETAKELPDDLSKLPENSEYEDLLSSYASSPAKSNFESDEYPSLEATLAEKENLSTHLFSQLFTSELNLKEREFAVQIIGNLDSDGYLRVPDSELAESLKCTVEEYQNVLTILQTFDPVGVFSRSISECLSIQLENIGQGDSLASELVKNHLDKIELKKYDELAKDLNISKEEIYDAIKQIRNLEPRPTRDFADDWPVYIVPDVFVKISSGKTLITLNEAGMPKLRLSRRHEEILNNVSQKGKSSSEKSYVKESIKSASWLIKSVEQRQQTIFNVTESIFKFQKDFLEQGVASLKPLVLREVAEDIGMHESTISRVTTNKFVHTPQGVFELKFFFSSKINSTSGGEVSASSVKDQIQKLIKAEDPKKPLSDQALVKLLCKEGTEVARRTVAKYRESLGILSSTKRKKLF